MEIKYWFLIIGILIGWITKVPFLFQMYRELRQTKDYQKRKTEAYVQEVKRLEEIYKIKYPIKP